ncbi:diaminopimelate decarboxylase [Lactobacillus melliventris]|uniref:Diaminopimelate decarboxylase n=1 Tax=Lactobacillus melliventris TaxID=1218507 RepID=A0ABX5N180_9LACO|nr:diaminopimelate decarboxylase [Lactobacillus melliventris]PXY82447.1 diaminopimelate decarboxylase [Lactobacillus melliventris]
MTANDYYQTNTQGHLIIGGVDALELAKKFGTPLVVYDVQKIKRQFQAFQNAFEKEQVDYAISYASKAFATMAIYQVINKLGGHIDVVSGGELFTALKAGFPAAKISFHGNNKTPDELLMAVQNHVGVIILDNFTEIKLLKRILKQTNTRVQVMLRVTPGVSAHTHEYDQTGQEDSKFGFDIRSGQAEQAFLQVKANPQMELIGLHAHIGSQILAAEGFKLEVEKLLKLVNDWKQKYDYQPRVLNLGGGFGIRYTAQDDTLTAQTFISQIVQKVKKCAQASHLKMPAIWIEPGRSIVGEAGYNLYTIGARKEVPGLLPYVAVDGGMGDNIRPALYQAEYEAVLAEKPHAEPVETVRLAGRYCESGDIIINKLALPKSKPGDVIAVLATGAYGYSMAANYNRVPRPAVVFAENGQAQVVVTRETYADIVSHDRFYQMEG